MNALTASTFMVLLCDESGPLDSFWQSRELSTDALIQLAKTMWLKRDLSTVLSAEWASKPVAGLGREFHITIPGTHEVKTAPKRTKKLRAQVADFDNVEDGDAFERHSARYWRHTNISAPRVSAPDAEVVTACCGISFTIGTFRELPLLGASDRVEGSTAIHDEQRQCRCGKALGITTKRLLGEKR